MTAHLAFDTLAKKNLERVLSDTKKRRCSAASVQIREAVHGE